MINLILQRFLWMTALVAAQLLVFNHIHLFQVATPLPFVYLLLLFPLGTEHWRVLIWGFLCGLLADITTLTPGVGAAAMTLTAFVQPYLLPLFTPKDAAEDMEPSYRTMGFWLYARYASFLTAIFCACYFMVLAFSFQHLWEWLVSMLSSWMLTLVLCLILQGFKKKKKHED